MGGQQSKPSKFDDLEDSRNAMEKRDRKRLGPDKEPQYVPRREMIKEKGLLANNNGTIHSNESSDDSNTGGNKTLPIRSNESS